MHKSAPAGSFRQPVNVRLAEDGLSVRILDQTQLPNRTVYLDLSLPEQQYEAIEKLRVRGAPAIGIFAAMAYAVAAARSKQAETAELLAELAQFSNYLNRSRPTAVNLSWALNRMHTFATDRQALSKSQLLRQIRQEAERIQQEDIAMCRAIAQFGLSLLHEGDTVLTHCNAGPLATSLYGTALGPVLLAKEKRLDLKVFADETRPLLQGARLTAYELQQAGVDVTLICDDMAGLVMKQGLIQACLVGCDRVAANGDAANKIGTSQVAVLANYYHIPFYVLGPGSTIDMNCPDGDHIVIEERSGEEIRSLYYQEPMAPQGIKFYNPAFDVTDHSLITAIVTEKGIIRPPFKQELARWFS
ncbi:S-methyl-5-thioribose-1-phosphate isomerase [Oscillospiraceae bacterium HV4-5-C5C]|nr:S-methyl-5-thioribose-1-phosphate isomerase [Oscillospiraceae bacterium HV4-5-C5C]